MKPVPADSQFVSIAELIARNIGSAVSREDVLSLVRACDQTLSLFAFAVGDLGVMEPELPYMESVVDLLGALAQGLRERVPGIPEAVDFCDSWEVDQA